MAGGAKAHAFRARRNFNNLNIGPCFAANGGAIAGSKDPSGRIRSLSPGATVRLGVQRGGAGLTVSVTLGAMAFDFQGRAALDMPALVALSKQDLATESDEVIDMCSNCRWSIWAIFCRRKFGGATMRIGTVAVICGTVLLSQPARAWWDAGHMQVAAAAWERLEPAVRDKVSMLIRLNPDYGKWIQGVADAEQDRAAFVHAATWADDIKSEAEYTDSQDTPSSPEASRNIGYADHLRHKYWHYMDIPFSPDETPVTPADPVNALTEIRALTAGLGSPALSDDVRSYDLVWLLHLVGDAHQPLHATSRFTHDQAGDQGGNAEKVTLTAGSQEKLHAFWDDLLGDRTTVAQAISAAAALPLPDPVRAVTADPQVWFQESEAAAEAFVYVSPIGSGVGPYPLTAGYEQKALEIAKIQVSVAGSRLAALINAALK